MFMLEWLYSQHWALWLLALVLILILMSYYLKVPANGVESVTSPSDSGPDSSITEVPRNRIRSTRLPRSLPQPIDSIPFTPLPPPPSPPPTAPPTVPSTVPDEETTLPAQGTPLPGRKRSAPPGSSRKEELCRRIIEEIYQKPFSKIRPDFLKNPETGYNLELDCYNEDLKLALEYNGIQHYVYPNFTNSSYEEFVDQLRRDIYKAERCEQEGIYLITVPYTIPEHMLRAYIEYYTPEKVAERQRLHQEEDSVMEDYRATGTLCKPDP